MASYNFPNVGGSAYWGDAVANVAALPAAGDVTGEIRVTLDTDNLYEWNGSSWQLILNSSGTVIGPASATDNALVRFDATTGKLVQNGVATEDDSGNITATSFQGPVTGNVTGDVLGNVTGDVLGNVTGNVSGTAASITGINPVANGGTNSSTALNNNRVMQSSAGAIVEAAAITASRALASDLNGIPVAVATTTTELGYVNGVTSGIQAQLNAKQALDADLTAIAALTGDGIPCQIAADTWALRQVVDAGSSRISVTNPKGIAGNIAIDVAEGSLALGSIGGSLGLTSQVTGVLPVANGGTNSSTVLSNSRVMVSSAGAIVEAAAITASRALVSSGSGIPVAAAATTATEIGYVNGVTSGIQAQLDAVRAIRANVAISSDVTLTDLRLHLVDTSAARSLALPAVDAALYLEIKDVTGSAQTNNITLTTPGAETIDGEASYVIDMNYWGGAIVSDGTNYFIL